MKEAFLETVVETPEFVGRIAKLMPAVEREELIGFLGSVPSLVEKRLGATLLRNDG